MTPYGVGPAVDLQEALRAGARQDAPGLSRHANVGVIVVAQTVIHSWHRRTGAAARTRDRGERVLVESRATQRGRQGGLRTAPRGRPECETANAGGLDPR